MTVVALGERALVEPYALAGAVLRPADTPADVRVAWRDLPEETLVVLLTSAAALALAIDPAPDPTTTRGPMTVVLPEATP